MTSQRDAGVCRVEVVPGGPALVRGADVVRGPDGEDHQVLRPVVAVCLCGKSQRQPWCDATHKVIQRAAAIAERAD